MSYLLLPGLPGWLYSGRILLAPLEQPKFHSCHLLFPAVLPWLFQPKSSPPSTRLSWLVPLLLAPGLHSLLSSQLLLQSFLSAFTSLHGLRCHSRRRRTGSSSLVLPHIQHPLKSSPMEAGITSSLPPTPRRFPFSVSSLGTTRQPVSQPEKPALIFHFSLQPPSATFYLSSAK